MADAFKGFIFWTRCFPKATSIAHTPLECPKNAPNLRSTAFSWAGKENYYLGMFIWVGLAFRNNLIYNAVAKREPFFARSEVTKMIFKSVSQALAILVKSGILYLL